MMDELASYERIGREFAGHTTVNHSADEYVRPGGFPHVNTAEFRSGLMKRAVDQRSPSAALPRRVGLQMEHRKIGDGECAALTLKGPEGRRLAYRGPHQTENAQTKGAAGRAAAKTPDRAARALVFPQAFAASDSTCACR
jgi:hypothetical protein